MYRPRIVWTDRGVCVPELSLQHLTPRVIETTGVLAMVLYLAADFLRRARSGYPGG